MQSSLHKIDGLGILVLVDKEHVDALQVFCMDAYCFLCILVQSVSEFRD